MILYSALYQSSDPFGIFKSVVGCVYPEQLTKDGVLLLHGGADISPSIYGETVGMHTYASNKPSKRDVAELKFIERALDLKIPIIGICRGAQLLCAKAGGKLVQDITGHGGGTHWIATRDGYKIQTNSIHHQMMLPGKTKHTLVAWADPPLSKHYLGEDDVFLSVDVEPEIVYFEDLHALAIQGHPEYLTPENPFVRYCTQKIREFLL